MNRLISKALILTAILSSISGCALAFDDFIIVSDGKLTDIKIEDNSVVNVFPVVTIMNEKNTFVIHPLKEGRTRIKALKNKVIPVEFDVKIENGFTKIEHTQGLDVLSLDEPPVTNNTEDDFYLPLPPPLKEGGK